MARQRKLLWISGCSAIIVLVACAQLIITYARPAPTRGNQTNWGAYSSTGLDATATPLSVPTGTAQTGILDRVVARTNEYRALHGCPALHLNTLLTQSAYGHSADMARHDFTSHVGSDGSTVAQRITATGYVWSTWAENIAWSFPTPEAAVDAWYNEVPPNDGHRRNILDCHLVDIGVGYYYLANDPGKIRAKYYWTQDFAVPRA